MNQIRKRNVWLVCVLAFFLFLVFRVEQSKGKAVPSFGVSTVPLRMGGWKGRDLEVGQDVYEILETKDVVVREYVDSEGDSVMLSMVFAQNNRDSFLPPVICYLGGGIELRDKGFEEIPFSDGALTANKLVMDSPRGTIKAWYWFLLGDTFFGSYYKQQIFFMLDALSGKDSRGALVRVSVLGDSERLVKKAKEFIALVASSLRGAS